MMFKRYLLMLLCLPVLAFGLAACGSDDDDSGGTGDSTAMEQPSDTGESMNEGMNIVETAQSTPELSTLVDAVVAAGLDETLSGEGPYTVFAPTDEAFAALPPAELKRLLKPANKDELAAILTHHVVEGDVKAADLSDGQMVDTVNGDQLEVSVDGDKVMIGDANVAVADVATSNGTVHVIDAVLLPQ